MNKCPKQSAINIAVLGAGSWGTALAAHLAHLHQHVTLWARDVQQALSMQTLRVNQRYLPHHVLPDNLIITADMAAAVKNCALILVVVPSHVFETCLNQLRPIFPPQATLVWATKGIQANGELLSQVAQRIMGQNIPTAVVAGPSFAAEVMAGLPTAITIASEKLTTAKEVADYFSGPRFRVYTSNDLIGAQLGGAVKNVLAIATGISDGLGFGANARSALITRGLAELIRLGQAMGAHTDTLMGLAGLGDLILTCTDNQSRNRRFGLALGEGQTIKHAINAIGQVVEGVTAAAYVYELAKSYHIDMPITEQVYRVLQGEYTAATAVTILLERSSKTEYPSFKND